MAAQFAEFIYKEHFADVKKNCGIFCACFPALFRAVFGFGNDRRSND